MPVWVKVIVSERARQNRIIKIGKKAEKLNLGLLFLQIDCSKKKYRTLAEIAYDYNGLILEEKNYPENLTIWEPIPPTTLIEQLFNEVCNFNYTDRIVI